VSWLEDCSKVPLADVADALGMEAGPNRSLVPCPACGAEVRSTKDRRGRGPVGVTGDGNGWRCHRGNCGAGGDGVALVAFHLGAARDSNGRPIMDDRWRRVREWYADRQWCESHRDYRPRPPSPRPRRTSRPLSEAIDPVAPTRPPVEEVKALWAACRPVDATSAGDNPAELWPSLYLMDRCFHPTALAPLDIVRVAPLRYPWPKWWPSSWARHWRLVIRAFEPDGTPASLHARAVPAYDDDARPGDEPRPKTRWPFGCSATGLLFADPLGLALLRGEGPNELRKVWIVEGLTDLASAAIEATGLPEPRAVLGAAQGGFSALAKVRWPDNVTIYAATDNDEKGNRYAKEIAETLAPRHVYRYPLGADQHG